MSSRHIVVAGGGMAGLGAALACTQADPGLQIQLLEQADAFAEVGAGIQLGPNAVRVLHDWGLGPALAQCAAFPDDLLVRDTATGKTLGQMRLGNHVRLQYGKPYATVHRADLHTLLLQAVRASGRVACHLQQRLEAVDATSTGVSVRTQAGHLFEGKALLGCDGVWSRTRDLVLGDGRPVYAGHLAYRGLVRMADLPQALRCNAVTAWLGPHVHAVQYPVRGGDWMNVVVVTESPLPGDAQGWDHAAQLAELRASLGWVTPDLAGLIDEVPAWRFWPLNAREPMRGPHEHGHGRVALLGDAAHPTRPYLAQGAAMALEDAWTLGKLLAQQPQGGDGNWPALIQHWANLRWRRNAWIQSRSRRNGVIFHAQGPLRWARNLAMATLGAALLDQPGLYRGPPVPL